MTKINNGGKNGMKAMRILAALLALALMGVPAAMAEADRAPMYTLTEQYGFKFGAALSLFDLRNPPMLDMVTGDFNSVTPTNELKAYSLLDERASRAAADGMPVMNYTAADAMLTWAQAHDIAVRGHTLVWDAYMCDWFFREGYDVSKPYANSDTVRARTRYYIDAVLTHFETAFPGLIYCWDVVNEAVGDSAGEYVDGDARHLRISRGGGPNLFRECLGDDYVEFAFLCARDSAERLGSGVKLYYNDYDAYFPEKAAAILALADSVNRYATGDDGAPRRLLDGIGMQGYIGGYGVQEGCLEQSHIGMIRDAILGYAAAGLEVQITEMAVRNFDPDQAERHAQFYADLFEMFTELCENGVNPLVAVTVWGLTDNPGLPKDNYVYRLNSPWGGLFTEKYAVKDAYRRVYEVLSK